MENYKIYAEILEQEALNQFYEAIKSPGVVQAALMPDSHSGYSLPIGAVVKTKEYVYPAWVGYDIGCGMCAVKTDIIADLDNNTLLKIKEKIIEKIPLGINKHKKAQKFKLDLPHTAVADKLMRDIGLYQCGTLGGGNHFLELGRDSDNFLNIVIHSGSRGFGKKIAEHYMKLAAIKNSDEDRYTQEFEEKHKFSKFKEKNPEKYEKDKQEFIYRRVRARLNTNIEGHYGFHIDSDDGKDYINDLNYALEFALINRKMMIDNTIKCIKEVLNTEVNTMRFINRNHNHAEIKGDYIIHRKGATHADKGMLGVIPGNMKDGSFIVEGLGNDDSMCSSSHGAGRVLSRSKAKQTLDYTEFTESMQGIITNHTSDTIDEAPKAYKNIFEVIDLQKDLVKVIDRVVPIINIKG